jgi:hypothetical protein
MSVFILLVHVLHALLFPIKRESVKFRCRSYVEFLVAKSWIRQSSVLFQAISQNGRPAQKCIRRARHEETLNPLCLLLVFFCIKNCKNLRNFIHGICNPLSVYASLFGFTNLYVSIKLTTQVQLAFYSQRNLSKFILFFINSAFKTRRAICLLFCEWILI